jgi:hypothetical protein
MSAGAVPSNEYLIETAIVSGTSTSTVTFENLAQYAGIYRHLKIVLTARSGTGSGSAADMRINGNSGDNYTTHFLIGNGSSVSSSASVTIGTGTRAIVDIFNISPSGSNGWHAAEIDILDAFSTTKNKVVRKYGGRLANDQSITLVELVSGCYRSLDVVSSISLYSRGATLSAGSRFSLYGVTA